MFSIGRATTARFPRTTIGRWMSPGYFDISSKSCASLCLPDSRPSST